MPEIIVGGRMGSRLAGSGYSLRVAQVRKSVGHLPPWRCDSRTKGRFYLCGHCFGLAGDGPKTNAEEMWMWGDPGSGVVPHNVRCEQCGGRAWPED